MRRVTVASLLVAALLVPGARAVSARQERPSPSTGYVVRPGDTLWKIAARLPGESDRRRAVYRLVELNGLGSRPLVPGQIIAIPRR